MKDGKDNLINLADRTKEEQREIARSGGIASGKSRRERKSLREAIDILLAKDFTNKDGKTASGVEVIAIGLFNKAKNGDTGAVRLLAELVGEAEAQGVAVVVPQVVVPDTATADKVNKVMSED